MDYGAWVVICFLKIYFKSTTFLVIYVIMLKIAEIFYKKYRSIGCFFCTFSFKEIVAENAGNRISEVLDF